MSGVSGNRNAAGIFALGILVGGTISMACSHSGASNMPLFIIFFTWCSMSPARRSLTPPIAADGGARELAAVLSRY
eukprot:CAMPEP_0177766482 /NCGR_PEP_ID=MMETSP0491_2-20121128/8546_1 /TAXON_ID=63592 /ORGANISM="Tetraselmis chuii, Strain PLY429" /LENGTH=75 /DNA_ID=CAMNT_0019282895 /DNA_START=450 /DNA_END=677 /DNA_ORIENTATION=-